MLSCIVCMCVPYVYLCVYMRVYATVCVCVRVCVNGVFVCLLTLLLTLTLTWTGAIVVELVETETSGPNSPHHSASTP